MLIPISPRSVLQRFANDCVSRADAIAFLVACSRATYTYRLHTDLEIVVAENALRVCLLQMGCTAEELQSVSLGEPVRRAYLWEGI